jgi:hypothetical protein
MPWPMRCSPAPRISHPLPGCDASDRCTPIPHPVHRLRVTSGFGLGRLPHARARQPIGMRIETISALKRPLIELVRIDLFVG